MKLEALNPSVKAITALLCVVLIAVQYLVMVNVLVFVISVLLLVCFSKTKLKNLCKLLLPAFIAAFGLFVTGYFHGKGVDAPQMEQIAAMPYAVRAAMSAGLYPALQLSTRLLAYAGFGMLFCLSTDGELFISSLMHQCRLPAKFAYGILAAIHLMPNIVREFRLVRLAFRARGMRVHWYSLAPIFTMLVNVIRWSECVAMAMESKGFRGEETRTYYEIPKIHWYDWLYSVGWIVGLLAAMAVFQY